MAKAIRISPADLKKQAAALSNLSVTATTLQGKASTALNLIRDAVDSKVFRLGAYLQHQKTITLMKTMAESLNTAAGIAQRCAEEYINADAAIRKEIGDSLPDEVKNTPTSTQEVVSEWDMKLEAMKQKPGFRQGDPWNGSNYVSYYNGYYLGASGCCAKAKQMRIEMTGKSCTYNAGRTNPAEIQVGDVIHYLHSGGQHWVFVTGIDGDKIHIGEGNFEDKVNYRTIDRSTFNSAYRIQSICR